MIWRSDTNAKCDYFNERWLAFTGRAIEEEINDGWSAGVHAEDLERCVRTYLDAFARREIFEMEYRLRRHDGEYRWVFDRGVPVTDDSGAFAGYIGSCVDVTERVEAQHAMTRAHVAEVRMLRGLLPICAWCKRIRDDGGHWSDIEAYLSQHSEARFSHSMCPDCQSKFEAEKPAAR